MNRQDLENRTRAFSLAIIALVRQMPGSKLAWVLGTQVLRSATSIGANYREAVRAESKADFIHKIAISEKEAGETLYWLELLDQSGLYREVEFSILEKECSELIRIFSAIGRTAKKKRN
ncbi:MAG TPA: four helix bundle protein [bacterium]|nr:four helix bundle protein [bacterium]HPG47426.1 four helix bundle protein [bacterium]HPM98846.1 four helix bundle protein [bacterium]